MYIFDAVELGNEGGNDRAWARYGASNVHRCKSVATEALTLATTEGNVHQQARALMTLGVVAGILADSPVALQLLEKAKALFESVYASKDVAATITNTGNVSVNYPTIRSQLNTIYWLWTLPSNATQSRNNTSLFRTWKFLQRYWST